jgi:hypothetical protein
MVYTNNTRYEIAISYGPARSNDPGVRVLHGPRLKRDPRQVHERNDRDEDHGRVGKRYQARAGSVYRPLRCSAWPLRPGG